MLIIQELPLAGAQQSDAVIQTENGVELHPNRLTGWVRMEEFHPKLAIAYRGFELEPKASEYAVTFKVLDEANAGIWWDGTAWVPNDDAHTADEMREAIQNLTGALRLELHFARDDEGFTPIVRGYKIGTEFQGEAGQIISYAVKYGLDTLLTDPPIKLLRWADSEDDPVPDDIAEAYITGTRHHRIGPQALQAEYSYRPPIFEVWAEYQVELVPCILARQLSTMRAIPLENESSDFAPEDVAEAVQAYQDVAIELTIIAGNPDDLRAIASRLARRIEQEGRVYLPPYGMSLPCKLVGGTQFEEPITAITEGQLPSAILELRFVNVPVV